MHKRIHLSQTTYIRAVKDSTLKFEKLDRLPEEGYPKEKGQTYLAIVPNDVEAWLNGVCGDADLLKINTRIFANLGVEAMGTRPANDLVVQKLSMPQLLLLTHCLNKGEVDVDLA